MWQDVKFNVKYRVPMFVCAASFVITSARLYAGEMLLIEDIAFIVAFFFLMAIAVYLFFVAAAMGKSTHVTKIIDKQSVRMAKSREEFDEDDELEELIHYDTPDGFEAIRGKMPEMTDQQYKDHYTIKPPTSESEFKRLTKYHRKKNHGKTVGKLLNLKKAFDKREQEAKQKKIESNGGELRAPMDLSPSPTDHF